MCKDRYFSLNLILHLPIFYSNLVLVNLKWGVITLLAQALSTRKTDKNNRVSKCPIVLLAKQQRKDLRLLSHATHGKCPSAA